MERDIQTQAVVTGSFKSGEINKTVQLFSPQLGLINAKIFGGRKGKKTSLAPLFSFGTFQLYYNPVRDDYTLSEADSSFIAQNIKNDIGAMYTASFFCELVNTVNTDEPEQVYQLITSALQKLDDNVDLKDKVLIDFSWKFLILSGVACDMSCCPECSKNYSEQEKVYFSLAMTSPVCSSCADTDKIILTPGARKYLCYTQNMSFEQASEVILLEGATLKIKTFLLKWVSLFSQKPLKTIKSGLL